MKKLLIATHNAGKLREYRQLLADLPLQVVELAHVGITEDVPEDGDTFAENARAKALAYARMSGLWTWADDSGLEVDALNGEPGVMSARYGGPGASDEDRYRLLLQRLEGVPEHKRTARFRCVIALASPQGEVHLAEGVCEGRITTEPRGQGGFGYDPVFFVPELGRTMAELTAEEKNAISHRGRAAREAREVLARLIAREA
ncbi:MAG: RdgB/HAM1 family non-canonical purine NTP pyrophosphatase [Anaerolineae bacterium]